MPQLAVRRKLTHAEVAIVVAELRKQIESQQTHIHPLVTRHFAARSFMSPINLPAPDAEGQLLSWLLVVMRPMSRTGVKDLLGSGRVAVNGVPTTRFDHPIRPGDRVTVEPRSAPANRAAEASAFAILYEDDHLIAIDKPAGLLSVATESEKEGTAFAKLRAILEERGAGRPFVVHRLDRETSGLLLFARSADVRDRLQKGWDAVTKTYLAVVEGTPSPPEAVVKGHLIEGRDLRVRACSAGRPGAKRAVTHYRVERTQGRYSLVEVRLETGRKHQIRVHLAGLGCPVAGDSNYGAVTDPAGRLALHAWRLAFDHPVTGKRVQLESPLPDVLGRLIDTKLPTEGAR
jgi:23S rRNA pseudouridine1911/1915/1917 synthase